MKKDETNTPQDTKKGVHTETDKSGPGNKPRQEADDKTQRDADEKMQEDKKSKKEDSKEVDELVQGKKLEEKYRGGDTTDVDEFKKRNNSIFIIIQSV